MPDINYYLKKADDHGNRLIYLQMKYSGQRLVFSTGQNVKEGEWNKGKRRAKTSRSLTADKAHSINDLLDNLQDVLQDGYNAEIPDGIPAVDTLKEYLRVFMNKNIQVPEKKKTLFEAIAAYKEKSGGNKYGALLTHLKEFNNRLTFNSIDLDFFDTYTKWLLEKKKLLHNSVAKDIKSLKAVMNYSITRKLTTNTDYKQFHFGEKESENVALSEAEILKLFRFDLSEDKRLERVKDLFVFGCQVGLRLSDYKRIRPENIIIDDGEKYIRIATKKTGEIVTVPCNEIVEEIFEKYKDNPNSLPKAMSDQKFNQHLKTACKKAGFTETGRLTTDPKKQLWEACSSHTARRSFATNQYLSGFDQLELRKITGHRSENAFLKYIKISGMQAAKRLRKHQEKTRSQRKLNIAS